MVDIGGWVKLYRCLMDKPIWKQSTMAQKVILVTLLMMANHDEQEWWWQGQKFVCKPGQFVTSTRKIMENAGKDITVQNVKTALNRFETFGFLTNRSTKTGRLITIENWELYQCGASEGNQETNQDLTKTSLRPNQDLTTNKNVRKKEYKNNKEKIDKKEKYGAFENVLLSDKEYDKLVEEFPLDYQERIERLSEYMASKGKRYKNHLATIRNWARKDNQKDEGRLDWIDRL